MQINLKQPGQPVADFSVSGAVVVVSGVVIDCAARQQDGGVMVEVRQNNHGVTEGGDGAYLAQIEIPAREFEEAPEGGEDRVALPLDPNAVVVTLWPTV